MFSILFNCFSFILSNQRPSAASTSATTPQPERWAQQLQQMRELGLNDDALNRQMLEVTNGDLQAAIDLVMTSEQS